MSDSGPGPGGCRVYLARCPARPDGGDLALLDPVEREANRRLATASLRARHARGHALLHKLLGQALDMPPTALRFQRDERGRLRLAPDRHPARGPVADFNLSASGDMVAVALAGSGRVGVDLERCRDGVDQGALLERHASTEERAWWRRRYGGERREAFFTLWTLKEAWSKADGAGLGAPLGRVTLLPLVGGGVRADLGAVGDDAGHWRFAWRRLHGPAVVAVAWRRGGVEQCGEPVFVSVDGDELVRTGEPAAAKTSEGDAQPLEERVGGTGQARYEQETGGRHE